MDKIDNTFTYYHDIHANEDTSVPDPHQDSFSKDSLGFWIYLMTDCLLFATLFATFAVLRNSTFHGPSIKDITDLFHVGLETLALLFSSVTCGLAMLAALKSHKKNTLFWLFMTLILGIGFLFLEYKEFHELVLQGNSWQRSGFLSSFFTLVGTHGLHVSFGILWMLVMIAEVYSKGIITTTFRRLVLFSMFWHFLDLIWIFIFTFVYLLGVV